MVERHIAPQQHYCILGDCFDIKIGYRIIRNYRPYEAALTAPQGRMRNVKVWFQPDKKDIFYETTLIYTYKTTFHGKETFNERQHLLKDELLSKMTFNVCYLRFFDQKSLISSFVTWFGN